MFGKQFILYIVINRLLKECETSKKVKINSEITLSVVIAEYATRKLQEFEKLENYSVADLTVPSEIEIEVLNHLLEDCQVFSIDVTL